MLCMWLALGTIGFWILVGIVSLLLIAAVEYEKPGWATFSLIVAFTLLWLLGDVNIVALALSNPLLAVGVVAGYFVIGALWSVGKWWFFVRKCREKYDDFRKEFLVRKNFSVSGPIPDSLKKDWTEYCSSGYGRIYSCLKPEVGKNKARILTWMVYWPWSMFWTLLNDPVKYMFKWIYQQLRAVYQRIADSAFKSTENDFVSLSSNPESETSEMEDMDDK